MNKYRKLILPALCIFTFILYSHNLNFDFTNWDDNINVTENEDILQINPETLSSIFTKSYMGMYVPLTMLSYAIDYQVDNLNPEVFHFTNIILHLLCIIMVFLFIRKLSPKIEVALIVSLLFAIHPMNCQVVSWISARSTMLFSLFFLASLIAYINYFKSKKDLKIYLLSVLFFILALLSKSQAMTLPLVLFLIDYYFNRKFSFYTLREKVPFLFLALLFGLLTIYFRGTDVGMQTENYTLLNKFLFIPFSLFSYILKSFAPISLSAYHPFPKIADGFLPLAYYLAPLFVSGVVILIVKMKILKKEIIFGTAFLLLNLSVVLHVVSINSGITAERYAYIPYIGIFFIIGNVFIWVQNQTSLKIKKIKPALFLFFVFMIVLFSMITFKQSKVWQNSIALYTAIINEYPDAALAYNNRGVEYYNQKMYKEAMADYNKAILLNQEYSEAYNNKGNIFFELKNYEEALRNFTRAIENNKSYSDAWYNRANTKFELKDFKGAINDFNIAASGNKRYKMLFFNRGSAKINSGDFQGAIEDFSLIIKNEPDNYRAYINRAQALSQMGDNQRALNDLTRAVEINPAFSESYNNRGYLLASNGKYHEAIADYNKAIELNPNLAFAFNNRGFAQMQLGNLTEAFADVTKSLEILPGNAEAYYNRGLINEKLQKLNRACEDWEKAAILNHAKAMILVMEKCHSKSKKLQ